MSKIQKVTIPSISLIELLNPPQEFVLTGSRFFGDSNLGSDWDYFTQNTPEIEEWIKNKGGLLLSLSIYTDRHTVKVYRLLIEGLAMIDIQLVKDVNTKREAQNKIFNNGLGSYLVNKSLAKCIWNAVLP
jgi:hypothetical protein